MTSPALDIPNRTEREARLEIALKRTVLALGIARKIIEADHSRFEKDVPHLLETPRWAEHKAGVFAQIDEAVAAARKAIGP